MIMPGIMAQDFFIVKNDKTTIVDRINTSINDNQSIIPINFRVWSIFYPLKSYSYSLEGNFSAECGDVNYKRGERINTFSFYKKLPTIHMGTIRFVLVPG